MACCSARCGSLQLNDVVLEELKPRFHPLTATCYPWDCIVRPVGIFYPCFHSYPSKYIFSFLFSPFFHFAKNLVPSTQSQY